MGHFLGLMFLDSEKKFLLACVFFMVYTWGWFVVGVPFGFGGSEIPFVLLLGSIQCYFGVTLGRSSFSGELSGRVFVFFLGRCWFLLFLSDWISGGYCCRGLCVFAAGFSFCAIISYRGAF